MSKHLGISYKINRLFAAGREHSQETSRPIVKEDLIIIFNFRFTQKKNIGEFMHNQNHSLEVNEDQLLSEFNYFVMVEA